MRTRGRPSWTPATHISRLDYSYCVVDRLGATYHRLCLPTYTLRLIRLRVHLLLLGMARDPCSKLDPAPGALLVLAQLMAGGASDLTSSTLSRPTHMTSASLSEDLLLRFRGSQALARKCGRMAGRETGNLRVPLGEALPQVRPSTALPLPLALLSKLDRRLVKCLPESITPIIRPRRPPNRCRHRMGHLMVGLIT